MSGPQPLRMSTSPMGMAAYGKPHQLHLKNVLILENAERIELRDNHMQAYLLDRFAGTGLTEFDIVAGAQAVVENILNDPVSKWCGMGEDLVFMGGVAPTV